MSEYEFHGIVPEFPATGALSRTRLWELVDRVYREPNLNPAGDSYFAGKNYGRIAQLIPLAEQAARARAKAGEDITVTSSIEVVPGRDEPLKELREEFVILDPRGVERSRLQKTPAPAGSRGGAYESTLQFTFPQGVPAGAYRVQSQLFVNGKPAQATAVDIQVAQHGGVAVLAGR